MSARIRQAIVVTFILGMSVGGVHAQLIQTSLPYPHNEAAGTGYAGSEVAGELLSQKRMSPAIAHAIPTAYGADFGDVFAGMGYQRYLGPRIPERNDGALFFGLGLGNARRLVGLEIAYASYAVTQDFFGDGSLSLKLHRHIARGFAVAAGVEDIVHYGEWVSKSAYAVASYTRMFDRSGITGASMTLGVGDGRFNTMANLAGGTNSASLFGSLSLQVIDRVNVLGTWYGQDLNLGFSFVVSGPIPITVTPVWVSVLDRHVNGDRIALSIGTRYRFP